MINVTVDNNKFAQMTSIACYILQNLEIIDAIKTKLNFEQSFIAVLDDIKQTPEDTDNLGYLRKAIKKLDNSSYECLCELMFQNDLGKYSSRIPNPSSTVIVGSNNIAVQISSTSKNVNFY